MNDILDLPHSRFYTSLTQSLSPEMKHYVNNRLGLEKDSVPGDYSNSFVQFVDSALKW